MRKTIVFILVFILVFSIQFKLVNGLSNRCRQYEDGVCQSYSGYLYNEEVFTEEVPTEEETPTPTYYAEYPAVPNFIILLFQLIGMVALSILLIFLIQSITKTSNKRYNKRK